MAGKPESCEYVCHVSLPNMYIMCKIGWGAVSISHVSHLHGCRSEVGQQFPPFWTGWAPMMPRPLTSKRTSSPEGTRPSWIPTVSLTTGKSIPVRHVTELVVVVTHLLLLSSHSWASPYDWLCTVPWTAAIVVSVSNWHILCEGIDC